MKKKFTLFLVTLAMVLMPVFAAQALPTIYTDLGSFIAAFPGRDVVENFQDTTLEPGLSVIDTYPNAVIADGVYKSIVNDANGWSTTWNLSGAGFLAWGGFWDLANPGGEGTSIKITAGGQVIGEIPNTYAGQFWGFSLEGGTPFTSVLMTEGSTSGSQETYWTVDLHFVRVPEPATMLLLGLGLLGLGIARRKN
jgi:hypothetical protein